MNNEQIKITYCAQSLTFESQAYTNFQDYENGLKNYFLKQPDGQDIFDDLQLRICEILHMRMKASADNCIKQEDIDFVQANIGSADELDGSEVDKENSFEEKKQPDPLEKKSLFREQTNKIVGGVSAGLGNYFSIDPIAFRLLFVFSSFMSKGLGLFVYIVLWIVLKPKNLEFNYTKRLFRSSKDQVVAGVCGGIATFFQIEAWIVRLLFLSPLLLNLVFDGFLDWNISIFNGSAIGVSLLAYIVLWITTTEGKTPLQKLLAKGENINVNTLAASARANQANPVTNSAFNSILRIIAFILIAVMLVAMIISFSGLSLASVFMYPLTKAVLHTQLLKWLGILSVLFFVLLPFVAFIVWAIRRLIGSQGPNKTLRLTFGGLWALGLASALTLTILLVAEFDNEYFTEQKIPLNVTSDTLNVEHLDDQFGVMKRSGIQGSLLKNFYSEDTESRKSKLVWYEKMPSPNDSFYVKIKISSRGNGAKQAQKNVEEISFKTEFLENTFMFSDHVSFPKSTAFRGQSAVVTVYVPKGKQVILPKGLRYMFFRKGGFTVVNESTRDNEDEFEENVDEELSEIEREQEEAKKEMEEEIENSKKEIENALRETKEELKKANDETKKTIAIEKQKLKIRKEELRLEELERQAELE